MEVRGWCQPLNPVCLSVGRSGRRDPCLTMLHLKISNSMRRLGELVPTSPRNSSIQLERLISSLVTSPQFIDSHTHSFTHSLTNSLTRSLNHPSITEMSHQNFTLGSRFEDSKSTLASTLVIGGVSAI